VQLRHLMQYGLDVYQSFFSPMKVFKYLIS